MTADQTQGCEYALVLLVTAAVTYLLVPLVRRVAVGTRTMHEPRARDTHTKPTPLLGGLAMYGGLVAGLLITGRLTFLQDPFAAAGSRTAAGLLLAGGLVVVVGFVDDRWGLVAISKLAAQVAAAGILVWSGQALPWLPTPSGGSFPLEPDLSVTLTILLVVVTINAINFIDGLDGLAAGIVAVAALSFLVYSATLNWTIGTPSLSLAPVTSALLAGMCLGFLPHNFYPARIFMGDIGAMLLGLLLAYGPISSTNSIDPALLNAYPTTHPLDRFPTILPLLMTAAIFVIPYTDLMFAIIRRTRAGQPIMVADRQHLHHRLLNIGHSYRQSVLIMYLWAALFSGTVVALSLVRSPSIVFAAATLVAVLTLLPVTMPRLRPWRARKPAPPRATPAPRPATPAPPPATPAPPPATSAPAASPATSWPPAATVPNGYPAPPPALRPFPAYDTPPYPAQYPAAQDPFPPQTSYPVTRDPFPPSVPLPSAEDTLSATKSPFPPAPYPGPYTAQDPFPNVGRRSEDGHPGALDRPDSYPQHPDAQPR
jgi:UDP-GlcNAc:undecaprenyl-phosphate/decaprenyl-phosphate GlcNAc-1-phosphate transferase